MKSRIVTLFLSALLLCPAALAEDVSTDDNVYPLLQQAGLFQREDKNAEAMAAYEKCLTYKLSPKTEAVVRGCLAGLYYDTDKEKAFDFARQACELDPSNKSLLPMLASIYAQRRDYDKAKELLQTYLASDPSPAGAESANKLLKNIQVVESEKELVGRINGALAAYKEKKYDEAIAILEETQKEEHDHWQLEQDILGSAYSAKGKYKQAIEIFKKSLERDPKQPKVVSALAAAYEGSGDLKAARATLKQYLHMENRGEMAVAAKDRTKKLKQVIKISGDGEGPDYFNAVCNKFLSRWSMSRMPLRVWIEPGTEVKNYSPEFDHGVARAMDVWCNASEGKLSWTRAADKYNCDIEVKYTDDPTKVGKSKSHSEAGVCNVRTLRQQGARIGAVTHADIILLTTEHDGKAYTAQEMYATAAHEVGHALGLREHSANPEDIMFFSATANPKEGLTERDINTVRAVYNAIVYDTGKIEVPGREEKQ